MRNKVAIEVDWQAFLLRILNRSRWEIRANKLFTLAYADEVERLIGRLSGYLSSVDRVPFFYDLNVRNANIQTDLSKAGDLVETTDSLLERVKSQLDCWKLI